MIEKMTRARLDKNNMTEYTLTIERAIEIKSAHIAFCGAEKIQWIL